MGKGILHLSVDSEIITLMKDRKDIDSLSNFIEHLFKIELGLKTNEKENEKGELRILNAKLSAEVEKLKIDINNLNKQLKEKLNKNDDEDAQPVAVFR